MLLGIVAKPLRRDKFEVTSESVAYLTGKKRKINCLYPEQKSPHFANFSEMKVIFVAELQKVYFFLVYGKILALPIDSLNQISC